MTKRTESLTTTSYAVLGLLCLRDWSTYELNKQMQRSMRLWWPRAESRGLRGAQAAPAPGPGDGQ